MTCFIPVTEILEHSPEGRKTFINVNKIVRFVRYTKQLQQSSRDYTAIFFEEDFAECPFTLDVKETPEKIAKLIEDQTRKAHHE